MLPSPHRLRRSGDFSAVMRGGQRAARNTVVVHVLMAASDPVSVGPIGASIEATSLVTGAPPSGSDARAAARFGLVVGRSVGNSVVRHRVSRRLRALLAARVDQVPPGSDVVVRARPEAAGAESGRLGADLDGALETIARRSAQSRVGRRR